MHEERSSAIVPYLQLQLVHFGGDNADYGQSVNGIPQFRPDQTTSFGATATTRIATIFPSSVTVAFNFSPLSASPVANHPIGALDKDSRGVAAALGTLLDLVRVLVLGHFGVECGGLQ